jgi:putative transcriptional regulator
MAHPYPASLKGQFLISMPGMVDPNFSRTVTCICEHTAEGAVGIVVNRVHDLLRAGEMFEELGLTCTKESAQMPIYIGGPVHINEVFILHGPPFGWDACLTITPSLAMSNSMDIMRAIAEGTGPESAAICIGCAGWGPSQLEGELQQNAWLNGPLDAPLIFDVSVDLRWEEAIRRIGIDPALLSDTAGHA